MRRKNLLVPDINSDIIYKEHVQAIESMNKKQRVLKQHNRSVYQGKDGYFYTYVNENGKTRKIKKKNEKDIIDFLDNFYTGTLPTVKEVFDMWISEKEEFNELSPSSLRRYKTDYQRFIAGTELESMRIPDVDEDILYIFIRKTIKDMNLTAKTYAGLRTILNGILKHAKRKHYTTLSAHAFFCDIDLGKNIFRRNYKSPKEKVFSEEEVRMITHYISEHPTIRNLAILLEFQTGLRVGELAALKASDFNLNSRTIHVQRTEITILNDDNKTTRCEVSNFTKTSAGDRYLIVPDSAIETYKRILELSPNSEYLISDKGTRIRENALRRALYRICDKVGIPRRSNHAIRRTYGTTLLDNDTDEILVKEQMGHTDIRTTQRFYYFCNKDSNEKRRQIQNAINW